VTDSLKPEHASTESTAFVAPFVSCCQLTRDVD
jgi:hypothetical protein